MLENLNWQMTLMNSNSLIYLDKFLTLVGPVMSWWNIHCYLGDIHWGCKSTHAIYQIASFLNFFQVFILWLSLRLCMSIMSPTWSIQKRPITSWEKEIPSYILWGRYNDKVQKRKGRQPRAQVSFWKEGLGKANKGYTKTVEAKSTYKTKV